MNVNPTAPGSHTLAETHAIPEAQRPQWQADVATLRDLMLSRFAGATRESQSPEPAPAPMTPESQSPPPVPNPQSELPPEAAPVRHESQSPAPSGDTADVNAHGGRG
jgi:hypothetical protein